MAAASFPITAELDWISGNEIKLSKLIIAVANWKNFYFQINFNIYKFKSKNRYLFYKWANSYHMLKNLGFC
jgi:hypothetical protein